MQYNRKIIWFIYVFIFFFFFWIIPDIAYNGSWNVHATFLKTRARFYFPDVFTIENIRWNIVWFFFPCKRTAIFDWWVSRVQPVRFIKSQSLYILLYVLKEEKISLDLTKRMFLVEFIPYNVIILAYILYCRRSQSSRDFYTFAV